MTHPDLAAAARRFFDAVVAHDVSTLRSLIADGAVLRLNGGPARPLALMSDPEVLAANARTRGQHRYDDIRQIVGHRAVVEQHRVGPADGSRPGREVCAVLRFDDDGRITQLDEHFDTAPASPR